MGDSPTVAGPRVLVALGTRPEVIKLAPVVRALRERQIPCFVLSTGQHREMLDQVLADCELEPDRDLGVMRHDQTLAGLSAELLRAVDPLLAELSPSWVVVQGDTTTAAMVALGAFYRQARVAHVEAGLRTHDRRDPFPEEVNRLLVARLAELHFAPTAEAAANLLAEGVAAAEIHAVGNTVVDSLRWMEARVRDRPAAELGLALPAGRRLVLVTGHRRESFGPGLEAICHGLRRIAEARDDVTILYPVHPNPRVDRAVRSLLGGLPDIHLVAPLGYAAFVKALSSATLVVTDSGGVQEEATALGVPTLVTRNASERREAIAAGVAELVGTDADRLATAALRLLRDETERHRRAIASDAFGDGLASRRIADALATALSASPHSRSPSR